MNKTLLMILDGWGFHENPEVSAIAQAKTPFIDNCYTKYPNARLQTSGLAVGLPEGQMGNSEVGHMNLGAGRVVYQKLVKINLAVEEGTLGDQPVLQEAFSIAKKKGVQLHFMGLVSDGGVHSHISHLKGLLSAAQRFGFTKDVFVHAFTDGRDCDPKSGKGFVEEIQQHAKKTVGELASVTGRYFAMDRDKRWERVKKAYDVMVHGVGEKTADVSTSIQASYSAGVTDEFLEPMVCVNESGAPVGQIKEGDVVVCFNFRTDRGREITEVLTQKDFPELEMQRLNLHYVTMTQYDETYKNVQVIYRDETLQKTLGEVLSEAGKRQIRIAETEKYPHVTFFFNGGREEPFAQERRILCPSPQDVATYDLKPEMAAYDIRDAILPEIEKQSADFICLNFANPDMVGHTGVMEAAIKACEVVDECAKAITEKAVEKGYSVLIIADHGNADKMQNEDGSPNTQHTTHLVPFILAEKSISHKVSDGKLGDLAPTILELMGLEKPAEMTGNSLISKV